jgi:hypothetical protein
MSSSVAIYTRARMTKTLPMYCCLDRLRSFFYNATSDTKREAAIKIRYLIPGLNQLLIKQIRLSANIQFNTVASFEFFG